MASESLQVDRPANAPAPRPSYRYRLRFQKAGDLRLVSHIDLLHVFERLLRRAELPFLSTQGFHPKPCLTFAQALALGVAGLNEAADLELAITLDANDVRACLNRHAPPGLVFLSVRRQEGRGSLQARRAFYRLAVEIALEDLAARCSALSARRRCIVERKRPSLRRIDIRPYIDRLGAALGALVMGLWITPYGAARPDEVVRALGLEQTLAEGGVLERTDLELMDELPLTDRWVPEIPRLADADVEADEILVAADDPAPSVQRADPLLPNPLSFET